MQHLSNPLGRMNHQETLSNPVTESTLHSLYTATYPYTIHLIHAHKHLTFLQKREDSNATERQRC